MLGLPYSKYVKFIDSTTFFVNLLLKFIAVSLHFNVDILYLFLFGLVCHSVTSSHPTHCDVQVGRLPTL